jgi:hypothetical protein
MKKKTMAPSSFYFFVARPQHNDDEQLHCSLLFSHTCKTIEKDDDSVVVIFCVTKKKRKKKR